MSLLEKLSVSIFADGADVASMIEFSKNPIVRGFTTNPSLMRAAGVGDYERFAREVVGAIPDRSISFEVFADDFNEMENQAHVIASWGDNVYAKIPISNSKGESSCPTLKRLANSGVKVNVTAIFTEDQAQRVAESLSPDVSAIVSVFAGRIADSGVDPMPIMRSCGDLLSDLPRADLLWASSREIFNIFQADQSGCNIITVGHDILSKLSIVGKDLEEYSLDTVKAFCIDAEKAGFQIKT